MTEKKEYPSYNINVGVATEIESLIKITTFKYHPYGLEGFRKDLMDQIEDWQNRGLAWRGFDNLTHAWRTPWDTHIRYDKLMSPIIATVNGIVNSHSPNHLWYVRDCWISEYTQSSAANKHSHGVDSLGWSFCYYVKVPDSGPGFTLCDDVNGAMHQINVTDGDLLLFRHPLEHQVFPALDKRIIISGNVVQRDMFDDILMSNMHNNEKYIEENTIINAQINEIDVDDWNVHSFQQKFGVHVGGGY